jgi:hypothetical protein
MEADCIRGALLREAYTGYKSQALIEKRLSSFLSFHIPISSIPLVTFLSAVITWKQIAL